MTMRSLLACLIPALVGLVLAPSVYGQGSATGEGGTVVVPAGRYMPLYAEAGDTAGVAVASFEMDAHPVTVERFAAFLEGKSVV